MGDPIVLKNKFIIFLGVNFLLYDPSNKAWENGELYKGTFVPDNCSLVSLNKPSI